jgi:2-oxoglutarate ferredoxin oxidoreductase subunit gamma
MQQAIVLAGFGGQGILFAGMVLAYAGMDTGKHVTWIPSYGPEMRGGNSHVVVVVSDEEIGSPVVRHPDAAVVFNAPSMQKYERLVKPGGALVYNSSLISNPPQRADIHYLAVPVNQIASELGDVRMANMVALGALVAVTGVLPLPTLVQALDQHLPEGKRAMLEPNRQALQRGAQLAEQGLFELTRCSGQSRPAAPLPSRQ